MACIQMCSTWSPRDLHRFMSLWGEKHHVEPRSCLCLGDVEVLALKLRDDVMDVFSVWTWEERAGYKKHNNIGGSASLCLSLSLASGLFCLPLIQGLWSSHSWTTSFMTQRLSEEEVTHLNPPIAHSATVTTLVVASKLYEKPLTS